MFLLKKVHSHIQCSMSDRVRINHCLKLKLDEHFEHTLLELKCNVHQLDSISTDIRGALKNMTTQKAAHLVVTVGFVI